MDESTESNRPNINDRNINFIKEIITPNELITKFPLSKKNKIFINNSRTIIQNIITGKDKRKLFIVGPCSIHNINEAKQYALLLKTLSDKINEKIYIIMRVYFEKPRTTTGWKGLINDPDLNGTYDINKGLNLARELLVYLANLELPAAYEMLDTSTPQYISDLITWAAVGARTTESQVHRQLVSGLSMPVGYKNSTMGDCKIAIDAIISSRHPHCFNGISLDGKAAIVSTKGNQYCHTILRGSNTGPNYFIDDIKNLEELSSKYGINNKIMIDCSHGNSNKNYKNQSIVLNYIIDNYLTISNFIGCMIESNINEGSQKLTDPNSLQYGLSITDSCISFKETIELLLKVYNNL